MERAETLSLSQRGWTGLGLRETGSVHVGKPRAGLASLWPLFFSPQGVPCPYTSHICGAQSRAEGSFCYEQCRVTSRESLFLFGPLFPHLCTEGLGLCGISNSSHLTRQPC